jgi:hypothetical protein
MEGTKITCHEYKLKKSQTSPKNLIKFNKKATHKNSLNIQLVAQEAHKKQLSSVPTSGSPHTIGNSSNTPNDKYHKPTTFLKNFRSVAEKIVRE